METYGPKFIHNYVATLQHSIYIRTVSSLSLLSTLLIQFKLEPVCCKKRQKIVPDQLLVCGVGDL